MLFSWPRDAGEVRSVHPEWICPPAWNQRAESGFGAARLTRSEGVCSPVRRGRLSSVKAAILVESLTGNTWTAAEKTARTAVAGNGGTITGLSKVREPDLTAIQAADLILVGTWVHGAFVFGQAPWAVNSISNLPALSGKKAAAFCTFALSPGKVTQSAHSGGR